MNSITHISPSTSGEFTTIEELRHLKIENHFLKKQLRSLSISDEEPAKQNFLLFMKNCTLHGVQDLYTAEKCHLKFLWTLILILAGLCSLYGCYSVLNEFLNNPVVVSYFVKEMDEGWILPDVVICPFNRFNRSYFHELNITTSLSQYLDLSFPSPVVHSFQMDEYNDAIENLDRNHADLENLLEKIGNMSFTEFIKKSSIDCTAFFQDRSICEKTKDIMTSAGKCFRIPGKVQSGAGFGYGQRFVINLPKHLYQPGVNQMFNDGIAVKLVAPGRGVDHDLTFIPSGVHAIMPLKTTKFEFKNDPPRYSCNENVGRNFSRMWCYETCLMEPAEMACNCSLAVSQFQRKLHTCTTKQFLDCFAKFLYFDGRDRQETCKRMCRQRCRYWQFGKTVSYAYFPSKEAKFFIDNQTEWEKLKNIIILDIYYESLDYTLIKHISVMTTSNIISQLGGQFSLWIGGSIISIIQIIIYFGQGTYISAKRQKRKKCRTNTNQSSNIEENYRMNKF